MVILKLVQSMAKQMASPPEIFRELVLKHFRERGDNIYERIKGYMDLSVTEDFDNGKLFMLFVFSCSLHIFKTFFQRHRLHSLQLQLTTKNSVSPNFHSYLLVVVSV